MTAPVAQATINGNVYVKASATAPVSGDQLLNVKDCTVGITDTSQETTALGNGGWETNVITKKAFTLDVSCFDDPAQTPQGLLETALSGGGIVYVSVEPYPNAASMATKGWTFPVIITDRQYKLDSNSVLTAEYKTKPAGAPIAVIAS